MDRYLVLASFDQKTSEITYPFDVDFDLMTQPAEVTLGFRQVFRKCFSAVRYRNFNSTDIHWIGQKFKLNSLFYFESTSSPFCETDGDIFLLGAVVSSHAPEARSLSELRIGAGYDEQQAIYSLLKALP